MQHLATQQGRNEILHRKHKYDRINNCKNVIFRVQRASMINVIKLKWNSMLQLAHLMGTFKFFLCVYCSSMRKTILRRMFFRQY